MTLASCHINVSSLASPGSTTSPHQKLGAWFMSKTYFKINIWFSRFLLSIAFSFMAPSVQRRMVLVARKGLHDSIAFSFGAKKQWRMGDIEASDMRFSLSSVNGKKGVEKTLCSEVNSLCDVFKSVP
jgi:hypothetical protein